MVESENYYVCYFLWSIIYTSWKRKESSEVMAFSGHSLYADAVLFTQNILFLPRFLFVKISEVRRFSRGDLGVVVLLGERKEKFLKNSVNQMLWSDSCSKRKAQRRIDFCWSYIPLTVCWAELKVDQMGHCGSCLNSFGPVSLPVVPLPLWQMWYSTM